MQFPFVVRIHTLNPHPCHPHYPPAGSGELPQALCRVAAVHGALYMLRTPLAALLVAPPPSGSSSTGTERHGGAAWLDGQQAAWEAAEEARKAAARADAAAAGGAGAAAAASPPATAPAPVVAPAAPAPTPAPAEPMAVGVVTAEGQLLRARAVVSGAAYVPRRAPPAVAASATGGPWAVVGATVVVTDAPLALPHVGDAPGSGSNSGASLVVIPPGTRVGSGASGGSHDHAVLVLQQGAGTAVTGPDGRRWLVHILTQAAVAAGDASNNGGDEPTAVAVAREAAARASAAVADALFQAAASDGSADGAAPAASGAAALPSEAPSAAAAPAADDGRPRALWRVSYSHAAPASATAAAAVPAAVPGLPPNWHVLPSPPALTLHPLSDALGGVRRVLAALYGPGLTLFAPAPEPAQEESSEGVAGETAADDAVATAAAATVVGDATAPPAAGAATSEAAAAPTAAAAPSPSPPAAASEAPAATATVADGTAGDLDVAAALALLREAEEGGLDL